MQTNWGQALVKVQRLKSRSGQQKQVYLDASLDESGWSPEALVRVVDLGTRLPYDEAAIVARKFGLNLSRSLLDGLTTRCAGACQHEVAAALTLTSTELDSHEPFAEVCKRSARKLVLQVDGVYVLGSAQAGKCPGLEIKSAVLYPQDSPTQRWMIAERCSAEAFLPLLASLVRKAGVTAKDELVGLGDGAVWIDKLFEHLQATRITDVYHACEYLDTVMQALGWDDDTKKQHRRNWYRGKVNARNWLQQHLPKPEAWLTWDEPAQTALKYLETRLDEGFLNFVY